MVPPPVALLKCHNTFNIYGPLGKCYFRQILKRWFISRISRSCLFLLFLPHVCLHCSANEILMLPKLFSLGPGLWCKFLNDPDQIIPKVMVTDWTYQTQTQGNIAQNTDIFISIIKRHKFKAGLSEVNNFFTNTPMY